MPAAAENMQLSEQVAALEEDAAADEAEALRDDVALLRAETIRLADENKRLQSAPRVRQSCSTLCQSCLQLKLCPSASAQHSTPWWALAPAKGLGFNGATKRAQLQSCWQSLWRLVLWGDDGHAVVVTDALGHIGKVEVLLVAMKAQGLMVGVHHSACGPFSINIRASCHRRDSALARDLSHS